MHVLAIPLIWAVIGFNAALFLGIYEDLMLLVAGVLATVLIAGGRRAIFAQRVIPQTE